MLAPHQARHMHCRRLLAPPVRAPHTALLPRKRRRPQRDGLECDARIFFEVRVRKLLGDFFFWRRMVRPTAPPLRMRRGLSYVPFTYTLSILYRHVPFIYV
jgi:hypothetical protein